LIAYFISNISAKKISKSIHVRQSYSKPKAGRFLRHGAVYTLFTAHVLCCRCCQWHLKATQITITAINIAWATFN